MMLVVGHNVQKLIFRMYTENAFELLAITNTWSESLWSSDREAEARGEAWGS